MPPSVESPAVSTPGRRLRVGATAPVRARLRGELAHHGLLIAVVAAYCIVVFGVLAATGRGADLLLGSYVLAAAGPIVAAIAFRAFGEVMHHAVHVRPFRPSGIWRGLRQSEIVSVERAAAGLVPALLVPVFSAAFTAFKLAIPEFAPFAWDPALMRADAAQHFGRLPWAWLQPVLGHPVATSVLSYLYNLWIPLMWVIVYWQIFRIADRRLRMRFLLSYVLVWAGLGSGLALLFSSAGPCFYDRVVAGPNPFAELMAYLHAAHDVARNWSVVAQGYLWDAYAGDSARIGGGISAMPSLHVCVAVLIVLTMRHIGRRLTWIAAVYALVIAVSSVHLGWHYALDGYVGAAGALAAWALSGWLVRRLVPPAPTEAAATG